MENDDLPVGRVLSRREALAALGALGAAALAGCVPNVAATSARATAVAPALASTSAAAAATPAPACVVRPAMTAGPYFVDEKLNRSDIRSDPTDGTVKDGTPLQITLNVSSVGAGACAALGGATVDVWHCDAAGVYSDATDPGFNTRGKKFLRGYQTTNASGQVRFTTIYPGWYHGRTVHVHFKIRTASGHDFTSQWFFGDSLTDKVFAQAPYAGRGERDTRNNQDGIYQGGGDQLLLSHTPSGAGYAATFDIGLQFT
jgi:protocatechuate 3,4-dioxygenase beta subunit